MIGALHFAVHVVTTRCTHTPDLGCDNPFSSSTTSSLILTNYEAAQCSTVRSWKFARARILGAMQSPSTRRLLASTQHPLTLGHRNPR
jgi:hypothetical protein